MLTALRVVARNFGEETLQGAYEVIQHQKRRSAQRAVRRCRLLSGRAHTGRGVRSGQGGPAYGLLWPGAAGGAQPDCDLHHCGVRAGTAVLHHGLWALQSAACLEAGHHIRPGNRHIRHPGHGPPHHGSTGVCRKSPAGPAVSWTAWAQSLTEALFQTLVRPCPAVAPIMHL